MKRFIPTMLMLVMLAIFLAPQKASTFMVSGGGPSTLVVSPTATTTATTTATPTATPT